MRDANDPFGVVTSDVRFAPKEPTTHYYGDNFLEDFYLCLYELIGTPYTEKKSASSKRTNV